MKFKAEIDVMPHDALLDPQGKAVTHAMASIGMNHIDGFALAVTFACLWMLILWKMPTKR